MDTAIFRISVEASPDSDKKNGALISDPEVRSVVFQRGSIIKRHSKAYNRSSLEPPKVQSNLCKRGTLFKQDFGLSGTLSFAFLPYLHTNHDC
jgi:hypothetical protein